LTGTNSSLQILYNKNIITSKSFHIQWHQHFPCCLVL